MLSGLSARRYPKFAAPIASFIKDARYVDRKGMPSEMVQTTHRPSRFVPCFTDQNPSRRRLQTRRALRNFYSSPRSAETESKSSSREIISSRRRPCRLSFLHVNVSRCLSCVSQLPLLQGMCPHTLIRAAHPYRNSWRLTQKQQMIAANTDQVRLYFLVTAPINGLLTTRSISRLAARCKACSSHIAIPLSSADCSQKPRWPLLLRKCFCHAWINKLNLSMTISSLLIHVGSWSIHSATDVQKD